MRAIAHSIQGVTAMVLGLKIKLREVLIRVILTIARWIIDHLDAEGDLGDTNASHN